MRGVHLIGALALAGVAVFVADHLSASLGLPRGVAHTSAEWLRVVGCGGFAVAVGCYLRYGNV